MTSTKAPFSCAHRFMFISIVNSTTHTNTRACILIRSLSQSLSLALTITHAEVTVARMHTHSNSSLCMHSIEMSECFLCILLQMNTLSDHYDIRHLSLFWYHFFTLKKFSFHFECVTNCFCI